MKRTLIWILASAIEVALVYFSLRGVQWCWNILRFGLWVMLVVTLLGLVAVYDKKLRSKVERSVPGWVSASFDVGVATTLAAIGHFGYATIVLVQQLLEAMMYKVAEEKE